MSSLRHWIWLSTRGPSPGMYAARLLDHFGTPERAYYAASEEYDALTELPPKLRQTLADKDLSEADAILACCEQKNISVLTCQDAAYPQRLAQLDTAPCVLYVRGKLPQIDQEAAVAIVGAREASPYGVMAARRMGLDLARQGALVISGSARGVDAAALQGALRGAQSDAPVRDRNKRSFWLSAARSALFNQIVSERLKKTDFNQVVDGDALQLSGRGSWFVATQEEQTELQRRVDEKELMITAALPGSGEWGTQRDALAFEEAAVADETALQSLLLREKVDASRRAMLLYPQQLSWNWWDDVTVELRFWLPAGSFATSVVRELINTMGDYAYIAE